MVTQSKLLFFGDFETTFKTLNDDYPSYKIKNDEYRIIAQAIYVEIDLEPNPSRGTGLNKVRF